MSAFLRLVMPSSLIGYLGYSSYQLLGNIFFKGEKKLQLYDDSGEPVTLPEEIKDIETEIITKLDWKVEYLSNIKLFMTHGMEIIHRGMVHSRSPAMIGIPKSFTYSNVRDIISWDEICKFYSIKVDRQSQMGKELESALIMSTKAKKFAIAREIFLADSYDVHCHVSFMGLSLLLAHTLIYYTDKKYLSAPLIRRTIYLIGGLFILKIYWDLTDGYTRSLEKDVDVEAAKLGNDYAEGGVEFYDKLIQITSILNSLRENSNQDKFFNSFRRRHIPLEHRKLNIRQHLKSSEEEEKSENSKV